MCSSSTLALLEFLQLKNARKAESSSAQTVGAGDHGLNKEQQQQQLLQQKQELQQKIQQQLRQQKELQEKLQEAEQQKTLPAATPAAAVEQAAGTAQVKEGGDGAGEVSSAENKTREGDEANIEAEVAEVEHPPKKDAVEEDQKDSAEAAATFVEKQKDSDKVEIDETAKEIKASGMVSSEPGPPDTSQTEAKQDAVIKAEPEMDTKPKTEPEPSEPEPSEPTPEIMTKPPEPEVPQGSPSSSSKAQAQPATDSVLKEEPEKASVPAGSVSSQTASSRSSSLAEELDRLEVTEEEGTASSPSSSSEDMTARLNDAGITIAHYPHRVATPSSSESSEEFDVVMKLGAQPSVGE